MIPVDMTGHGVGDSEFSVNVFKIRIPADAIDHPIWRIVDDPQCNGEILARLPMFGGTNLVNRLKPAATLLGTSDRILESADVTRARQAGRPIPPSRPRPMSRPGGPADSAYSIIFACELFGRGRTFAMATDTTWAWGTEFEKAGGKATTATSASSGGTWSTGSPRTATDPTRGCGSRPTRCSTARASRSRSPRMPTTRSWRRPRPTGLSPVCVVRLRARTSPSTRPRRTWSRSSESRRSGQAPAPPASEVIEDPGSTVHQLWLDAAALDGDRVVAESSTLIQLIDDPVEFRDPRPDFSGSRGSPAPRLDA